MKTKLEKKLVAVPVLTVIALVAIALLYLRLGVEHLAYNYLVGKQTSFLAPITVHKEKSQSQTTKELHIEYSVLKVAGEKTTAAKK